MTAGTAFALGVVVGMVVAFMLMIVAVYTHREP
jgi:hypothetical protein